MRKITVLCTLPMDPAGAAMLAPAADIVVAPDQSAESLYRTIGLADILVVRSQLPADLFDRPNRLVGVVRHGTGLDLIPVESATAHGIPVANVPGANAQAVVEYCIGSFLALARGFERMDRTLRGDGWGRARGMTGAATELGGKTVGIVGLGAIGAALARVCKEGFGMRVLGYQRHADRMPAFVEAVSLDSLFAQSDFISLNCPLTEDTRHLVNAARLRSMKPDAVIVNAARGAVIDEMALAQALRERWIKAAAVDVFCEQPLRADHPFLALDNILLTPHAAALTRESSEKMGVGAARQILLLLNGERPEFLVNPKVWERRRRPADHDRQGDAA
jgi:D-3-phosphoglycerate dehydrogenase / 2-oxoglutarate reductase